MRYFAEASNRVVAINVFVDGDSSFGGLCSALLKEIRDDMGSHVQLPVWSASRGCCAPKASGSADLTSQLEELNAQLLYAAVIDQSNLFVPLSCNPVEVWEAFIGHGESGGLEEARVPTGFPHFAVAAAIESACSAFTSADRAMSVVEWCSAASGGGRWPVAMLEAAFAASLAPHGSTANALRSVIESSFKQRASIFEDGGSVEKLNHMSGAGRVRSSAEDSPLLQLNPFCSSLSAALHGPLSAVAAAAQERRVTGAAVYRKPFANMLNINSSVEDSSPGMNIIHAPLSPVHAVHRSRRSQTSVAFFWRRAEAARRTMSRAVTNTEPRSFFRKTCWFHDSCPSVSII